MVTSTQKTNKSNMTASVSKAEEQPNVSVSDDESEATPHGENDEDEGI